MNRRRILYAAGLLAAGTTTLGLTGCAAPKVGDYASEKPVLDLRKYFNGIVDEIGRAHV